jgi:hypothetical protein
MAGAASGSLDPIPPRRPKRRRVLLRLPQWRALRLHRGKLAVHGPFPRASPQASADSTWAAGALAPKQRRARPPRLPGWRSPGLGRCLCPLYIGGGKGPNVTLIWPLSPALATRLPERPIPGVSAARSDLPRMRFRRLRRISRKALKGKFWRILPQGSHMRHVTFWRLPPPICRGGKHFPRAAQGSDRSPRREDSDGCSRRAKISCMGECMK